MRWRVIPIEVRSAAMNMAIDEAISKSVSNGANPTIRFYKWLPSAVSIGYFQSLNDVVNKKYCKRNGVNIVRRRTGGGAVYHSNRGEITYSVIGPVDMFPKNIIESYKLICGWVILGLKNLDIHAEFQPINDIIVKGKKISGNAQTRRNNILLQHGTILYDVDVEKMFSMLRVPDEKLRANLIKSAEERVTRVLDFKQITATQTYEALLKGFTQDKEFDMGSLTDDELINAERLAISKYGTDEWNCMR
jgi:lipoate---protein ligase